MRKLFCFAKRRELVKLAHHTWRLLLLLAAPWVAAPNLAEQKEKVVTL